MSQALPAGVLPDSTQTSGPPRPEPVERPSAPGVCALCEDHYPLLPTRNGLRHFQVSERGEVELGPCTTPPKHEAKPEAKRARTHEEALARLHEIAATASAASVLGKPRQTYSTHSEPREEDEDAD